MFDMTKDAERCFHLLYDLNDDSFSNASEVRKIILNYLECMQMLYSVCKAHHEKCDVCAEMLNLYNMSDDVANNIQFEQCHIDPDLNNVEEVDKINMDPRWSYVIDFTDHDIYEVGINDCIFNFLDLDVEEG